MNKRELNKELGKRIRQLRRAKDMTQLELGKAMGISHAAISDMERGKTKITFEALFEITNILNTTISEILYITEIENIELRK